MITPTRACATPRPSRNEHPLLRCERHRSRREKACPPKEQRQLPPQPPQPPFVINQPPLNNQSPFIHEDFLGQEALQGEPKCTKQEFYRPRLRYCPFAQQLQWGAYLGHGMDGMVWEAHHIQPYAVKVFWEAERRDPERYYWAPEIECRNAALLEKIQSSSECVLPYSDPTTRDQAQANLLAFSDNPQHLQYPQNSATAFTLMAKDRPRLRRCYGWTTVTSRGSIQAKIGSTVRTFVPATEYLAIVYEFVEESILSRDRNMDQERCKVQTQLDFLWRVGFYFCIPLRAEDWCAQILLDMSVLRSPWHRRHPKWRKRPKVEDMEEVRTFETIRKDGSSYKTNRHPSLASQELLGPLKEPRAHGLAPPTG
ncbi:hypothetical protein Micbo1qcDRAFT_128347 [Microdochium bolleyi]|uniref:Protein kinase domain-containing protein n=1 Tax=Microdochium bolleyi TaxID=196109 RepID=A0A136IJZ3_9PEZI|nr:hypothetical protein Micbo1qcDRAFT_128347 [Microdochium bolleyi]